MKIYDLKIGNKRYALKEPSIWDFLEVLKFGGVVSGAEDVLMIGHELLKLCVVKFNDKPTSYLDVTTNFDKMFSVSEFQKVLGFLEPKLGFQDLDESFFLGVQQDNDGLWEVSFDGVLYKFQNLSVSQIIKNSKLSKGVHASQRAFVLELYNLKDALVGDIKWGKELFKEWPFSIGITFSLIAVLKRCVLEGGEDIPLEVEQG